MKKLEKLRLIELNNSMLVLDKKETYGITGGSLPGYSNPYQLGAVIVTAYRDQAGPSSCSSFGFVSWLHNSFDPSYWNDGSDGSAAGYYGGMWGSIPMIQGSDGNWYTDPNPPSGGGGGGGGTSQLPIAAISEVGLTFLQSYEKGPGGVVALTAYDDNGSQPGGYMTIGWGHQIMPGEDFSAGITEAQAEQMLINDLTTAMNDVMTNVTVSLTQYQFDALVSYSFNIGGLSASPSCLQKLNNGDYAGAAAEMDIVTSAGVELPGLVERREYERQMFLYGTYINHN